MDIIFNEYYNLRNLGKGSFATVFKAKHIELGYIRAVKVSKDIVTGEDDKSWQTFLKECKLLLKIGNGGHPNIVRIYQPRRIGNNALVEMDYIDGESLHDYIDAQDKYLPMNEVNRFIKQIVSALAYCHVDLYKFLMDPVEDNLEPDPSNGKKYLVSNAKEQELIAKYCVVHNDLHSGNIMRRDYDGAYILLDFGLAKQDGHFVKSSSRNDGSREYCPPEKFDGKKLTAASDVYSLGILMFEALTGEVPFKAPEDGSPESKASALEKAHKYDTPPSISELRKKSFEAANPGKTYVKDYPDELDVIIRRCLAKNPADRYKNAKELQEALLAISAMDTTDLDRRCQMLQTQVDELGTRLKLASSRIRELKAGITLPTVKQPNVDATKQLRKAKSSIGVWKRVCVFLSTLLLILIMAATMWYFGLIEFYPNVRSHSTAEFGDTAKIYQTPETMVTEKIVRDTVTVVERDTVFVEVPVEEDYPTGPIPELHISRHLNDLINSI